jgi:hypothetical protein
MRRAPDLRHHASRRRRKVSASHQPVACVRAAQVQGAQAPQGGQRRARFVPQHRQPAQVQRGQARAGAQAPQRIRGQPAAAQAQARQQRQAWRSAGAQAQDQRSLARRLCPPKP